MAEAAVGVVVVAMVDQGLVLGMARVVEVEEVLAVVDTAMVVAVEEGVVKVEAPVLGMGLGRALATGAAPAGTVAAVAEEAVAAKVAVVRAMGMGPVRVLAMAVVLVVVVMGTEVVAVAAKVVGLAGAQATVPGLAVDMVEGMEPVAAAAAVVAAEVAKVEALAMAPGLALDTVTAPAVASEMGTTDLTSMESSSVQENIVKTLP